MSTAFSDSAKRQGWWQDIANARLAFGYGGTQVGYLNASTFTITKNLVLSGGTLGVTGALTVTSADAKSLAVGPNGATTPIFSVDSSTASAVAGLKVTGATVSGTVAVAIVGSTNGALTLDAQGSGTIGIGTVSTGAITLARATGVTGALTVTSAAALSLAVGPNGATTPILSVDSSVSSAVAGILVTGATVSGNVSVAVTGSTNGNLRLDAQGSGTVSIGVVSTGNIALARTTQVTGQIQSGAVSARATTTGISMIEFKQGTAPVGAATTTAGLFTNGTSMQKIIADGTVSIVG